MNQNLKILAITLLICYVIVEIAFRIDGKYMSYGEKQTGGGYNSPFAGDNNGWAHTLEPHSEHKDVKSEFTTFWIANNEGLNDKDLSIPKKGKRLLILGDSFTEGVGATNDNSYPRILDKMLRAGSGDNIEVINAGTSAADIFTEYELLKNKMLKYSPDLVVVTFNSTDINEFITRGGFERFVDYDELKYRSAPWFEFLYARSYIVRRIVHDGFGYNYQFLKSGEEQIMTDSAYKSVAAAMDSFSSLCKGHNIRLGFIFHPMCYEISHPENYKIGYLTNHCKANGLLYEDELPFLHLHNVDSSNCQNYFWPKDGHCNAHGYDLLAGSAYTLVTRMRASDN